VFVIDEIIDLNEEKLVSKGKVIGGASNVFASFIHSILFMFESLQAFKFSCLTSERHALKH